MYDENLGDGWASIFEMPMRSFTRAEINAAGALVAARNKYPVSDEIRTAFATAHQWRDGHVLPMRSIRQELKQIASKVGVVGQTSGRLKRFQSIRKKLQRLSVKLHQLQDLAGCRIIVEDIAHIAPLVSAYHDGYSRHEVLKTNDYIKEPKKGGYRSTHFVLLYGGDEEKTGGNRLTVELQIRTRLQHAWATAVEAVGTVLNTELKSGQGDERWLRFFELMSTEFAVEEGQPIGEHVSDDADARRKELLDLERELDAVTNLESYQRAIRDVDDFRNLRGSSFLIEYDSTTRSIAVRVNRSFSRLSDQSWELEQNEATNAVYVEVDRVSELVSAYPNYFLDVKMFTERLRQIVSRPKAKPAATTPAEPLTSDAWLTQWVSRSSRMR